jgi:hypothetical protein
MIGFLSQRAYRDGKQRRRRPGARSHSSHTFLVDTLEHFEVPFFGRLANSFVDNE